MKGVIRSVAITFILTIVSTGLNCLYGQSFDVCQLYGSVYATDNPREANFRVFLEDSEAFADLVVFVEDNRLMADGPGLWFMTESQSFAHFTVYFEKKRGLADFSVFYTDILSFAGCK